MVTRNGASLNEIIKISFLELHSIKLGYSFFMSYKEKIILNHHLNFGQKSRMSIISRMSCHRLLESWPWSHKYKYGMECFQLLLSR